MQPLDEMKSPALLRIGVQKEEEEEEKRLTPF